MRLIFLMLLVVMMYCAPPSNVNVITIDRSDVAFIENWRSNGIKIIKIDTLRNGDYRVHAK